jgi:hypothetical protein
MLATLSLEREPPELDQVFHFHPFRVWPDFGFAEDWVRVVGTIAAIGILACAYVSWIVRRRDLTLSQIVIAIVLAVLGLPALLYFLMLALREGLALLRGEALDEYSIDARPGSLGSEPRGSRLTFLAFCILSGIAYLVFGATYLLPSVLKGAAISFTGSAAGIPIVRMRILTIAAGAALLAALVWPLRDLAGVRWRIRRIWAIARLSIKEAIRRRVLWVFLIVLLFFLFGMWFLPTKPEDQIRSYVQAVFLVFALLLVLTLSLVAAFSIPTDIKSQTIHTILTKPVERFELLLGRFLGFGVLMTIVLIGLTGFSLLYLMRELDKDAVDESLKARVPIYGVLQYYEGDTPVLHGTNVGRAWEYREYIGGKQAAVWKFKQLPDGLSERDSVPCEFAFDIHRTIKGEGIRCGFYCKAWHFEPGTPDEQHQREAAYRSERHEETGTGDPDFKSFVNSWLILKYGYYEPLQQEIGDMKTFVLDLPVALFEDPQTAIADLANEGKKAPEDYKELVDSSRPIVTDAQRKKLREREETMPLAQRRSAFAYRELPSLEAHVRAIKEKKLNDNPERLAIRVNCDSPGQYIGMEKHDLYLLDKEYPFWYNFFKGSCGIWLLLLAVLGLNIALSTYLSAIIGWLAGLFWLILGLLREFITALTNPSDLAGSGPMESLYRLAHRQNMSAQVSETAAYRVALGSDEITRVFFRGLLWVILDYDHFWYTDYVAEGFNIGIVNNLGVSVLYLLGWVVPFALLGYYTMKWREVASAQ